MSTFLISLLTSIAEMLIRWAYGDIQTYIEKRAAQVAADKETEEKNAAAREKNEKAVTPEERDEAAGDIFRNNGNSPS